MDIILASASPRRKELLSYAVDSFKIIPANTPEIIPEGVALEDCPAEIALQKAREVSRLYPGSLVIGCDTVVIIDGNILGKPKDKEEAYEMLSLLSGKTHCVITGCALCFNGKEHIFSEITKVTFYPLSKHEILTYIESGEPFDKAGAYGIQEKGSVLVEKIEGDFFNVVGLPVARLKREIEIRIK